MVETSSQRKDIELTFGQKYGIKYYSYLISQSIMLCIILITHNPNLSIAFLSFYNLIGNYLPIKADQERQKQINKIQNSNKYLLGPLIVSCITTPVIICIIWREYDNIVQGSMANMISMLFCIGFLISGSIDASHELLHRPQPICKFFSYLNLFFLQFTIYPTEHLYLHHKKVGTSDDPITSPKNRTIYRYYFNALYSCYKFNFNYSKKIFAFNVASTILYNCLLFAIAIKEGSNVNKAIFFSALSYATLFIMQAVQYIQHYGLVYRINQKQTPISQLCSWNTRHNQLINWLVFRFQRHSDHHMNAYKIYPTLNLDQKMPQFPFDFISGIILSLVPPLWFKLINPLVDQVIEGKKVTKEHRALLNNSLKILQFVLLISFPLRLIEQLYHS